MVVDCNRIKPIEVSLNATVVDLKRKLVAGKVTWNSRVLLEPRARLVDFGMVDGDIVRVSLRLMGGAKDDADHQRHPSVHIPKWNDPASFKEFKIAVRWWVESVDKTAYEKKSGSL